MAIRAWLDLRAGIGKAVKNLKISSEKLKRFFTDDAWQSANYVRMTRVLYRKSDLCFTHSFLNLSGINTLSKTVV